METSAAHWPWFTLTSNNGIRKMIRMSMALPFLPRGRTEDGVAAIEELTCQLSLSSLPTSEGVVCYSFIAYNFNNRLS